MKTDLVIYLITIQYCFIQYRRTLIIFCHEASGNDLPRSWLQLAVSPDNALYCPHGIVSAYKCLSNLSTPTVPTPKTRCPSSIRCHIAVGPKRLIACVLPPL